MQRRPEAVAQAAWPQQPHRVDVLCGRYGSWKDLQPHVQRAGVDVSAQQVLVIGCGNSSLSADMYDAGYTAVRSVDFSDAVIDEMRAKHAAARPGMAWDVMDVTNMAGIGDGSVDVVMDKGMLDALYAEDTDRDRDAVLTMFRESACGGRPRRGG